MGSEISQEQYNQAAIDVYENPYFRQCHVPDVGIDESLLKYSGVNSNSELQTYTNELVNSVPGFVESLGSTLAGFSVIPNAVGLGALIISMFLEIIVKSSAQNKDDTYNLLRRVFGEEKASSVRDTMLEYVKRHKMHMNNDNDLLQELQNLERRLSHELTTLKNSLLQDGQMSTRGFKIWVNGASFHVQMLIHKARLSAQTEESLSQHVNTVGVAIDLYLTDLQQLLQQYKTYKNSITKGFSKVEGWYYGSHLVCYLRNTETNCEISTKNDECIHSKYISAYIDHIFTNYDPIAGLVGHFMDAKQNLNTLIQQHDTFLVPSAA